MKKLTLLGSLVLLLLLVCVPASYACGYGLAFAGSYGYSRPAVLLSPPVVYSAPAFACPPPVALQALPPVYAAPAPTYAAPAPAYAAPAPVGYAEAAPCPATAGLFGVGQTYGAFGAPAAPVFFANGYSYSQGFNLYGVNQFGYDRFGVFRGVHFRPFNSLELERAALNAERAVRIERRDEIRIERRIDRLRR